MKISIRLHESLQCSKSEFSEMKAFRWRSKAKVLGLTKWLYRRSPIPHDVTGSFYELVLEGPQLPSAYIIVNKQYLLVLATFSNIL